MAYPVNTGGVVSRCVEAGHDPDDDTRDVIVCLHGSGSRADRWAPCLPGLAEAGYHACALDFPGHGFAAKGDEIAYTTPKFARCVGDFCQGVTDKPYVLAGTSLGGHVAATVAIGAPASVRALILIGAVGLVPPIADRRKLPIDISDGTPAGVRKKLEFLVYDPTLVSDAWVLQEMRINSSPGARGALAAMNDYLNEGGLARDVCGDALQECGIPTLLIWGGEDRWVPPELGHAAAAKLQCPLVIMEKAGHAPYFERPDTFVDVVTQFLTAPQEWAVGTTYI